MNRFSFALLTAALLTLAPGAAWAQSGTSVKQSGTITPGHVPNWETNGVLRDGGPAADGKTKEVGITNTGLPLCINDAPVSSPTGYHRLCFGHGTDGSALINVDALGGALAKNFLLRLNGIEYTFPLSAAIVGSDVAVPSNAVLKTLQGALGKRAVRLGFYSPGDGGLTSYNWSEANCAQADNGAQVQPTGSTGCWVADFAQEAPSIQVWGAKCDGTTDDAVAITAAMLSSAKTVSGPDVGVCRSSATVVVPGGSTLKGRNPASMGTNAGIPGGFTLKCDLAVSPCIRMDGNNSQSTLMNVGQDRAAGTPPAGSIGVQLNGGMYTILENVGVYRNAIGIQEYDLNSTAGLGAFFNRVLTCVASTAHLEISGWRETRINQSRFGCNGALDVASRSYIHLTGGHGDGPNTVHIVNSQFNQGSAALVDCFMRWDHLGAGTDGPTSGWNIESVEVEQASSAFCTDSSVVYLNALQVSNSKFYGGFTPNASFFRIDPATTPSSMNLTGNQIIAWGDITIAPSNAFFGMIWTGNEIITTGSGINLTGVGQSQALLYGNRWQSMHLTGNWGGLGVYGTGGINSNTATGYLIVEVPGYGVLPCNMKLQFTNNNAGITYKTPTPLCQWQRDRNAITLSFYLELTSKGSANGTATLSGLPYLASFAPGLGSNVLFVRDMAGLGGPVIGSTGAASARINLYKTIPTGLLELDDTNFTDTTVLQGIVTYILDASTGGLPPVLP